MKRTLIITALFLVLAQTIIAAPCGWDKPDTVMLGIITTLQFMDYRQTLQIADAGAELNPFLGRSPSKGKIQQYFLLYNLGVLTASCILSNKHRKWFQMYYIGMEGYAVYWNYRIGFSF